MRAVAHDLGVPLEEICFVGDAPRDAPALEIVGLGLAPADAAEEALAAADRVLAHDGGRGAVGEADRPRPRLVNGRNEFVAQCHYLNSATFRAHSRHVSPARWALPAAQRPGVGEFVALSHKPWTVS